MDTPLLGFSHLQLRVRDVAASCAWYTTVLGVETMTAADDNSYVALRHRASHMVIVISSRVEGSAEGTADVPLDHVAFAVPDGETLHLWADHLTEVGIDHPGVALEMGKPTLQLVDPDGINVELVAPAPRN
ncbi:MAG TPA: VOC family protein [Acidimicrobiia bacterium]|jgi:catechol-2,3-dioxygenase